MKACIIVFPGSNCDRDVAVSVQAASGHAPMMVWHADTELPACDLIVLPGGFSYGDYLRSGAMAARAPIMREVVARARSGTLTLGICNGFQLLTEAGLLPGALMRNADLRFICKDVNVRVERTETPFTGGYAAGQVARIPIAHHDGNYYADPDTLDRLEGNGQIAFRYCADDGSTGNDANPNGSQRNIAGILNQEGNVLGMMPHPERLADPALGGIDGKPLFDSLAEQLS